LSLRGPLLGVGEVILKGVMGVLVSELAYDYHICGDGNLGDSASIGDFIHVLYALSWEIIL
jgi:hypothetical protein